MPDRGSDYSNDPLNCWVISDGRRGIENQAWGLAEAIADERLLEITRHTLNPGRSFRALPPLVQFGLKTKLKDYTLPQEAPDIAIGCGRQAIAPLLALKKNHPDCFTVYVQDPKIAPRHFDLVIAPSHDNISGPNVETMIGAPNRITRNRIVKETLAFEARLQTLPMPRAAMLIGGPSKTYEFTRADHENHMGAAKDLLNKGYSLLITPSRRTPDWAISDYLSLAQSHANIWMHKDGEDNPYFAFLGGAEIILVTAESTNMLTESCSTGKPVFLLPLSGNPGKFEALHKALKQRCNLAPYAGQPVKADYEPLRETARIADRLWAHYDKRSAALN